MELEIKKITPKDIFITALESDAQKWRLPDGEEGKNRLSGNELIDKLADLINTYGMNTTKFYETQIGLGGGLSHLVRLYSGMEFKQWRNEYIMLAAKELLVETKYTLAQVGQRLGFSGIYTFSRWFIRMEKTSASKWRRMARHEMENHEKRMFIEFKKGMERPSMDDE